MPEKAHRGLVYVLGSQKAGAGGGHSLGVNALAVDAHPPEHSLSSSSSGTLYSAGRDGVVCAWDLEFPLAGGSSAGKTEFRSSTRLHTNWINDILLKNNAQQVVTCSSDLTVKLWEPYSGAIRNVGTHRDYVKCLATPSEVSNILVSGGLDHQVITWDLTTCQKLSSVDIGAMVSPPLPPASGSVYALAASQWATAAGGPDAVVRLFDTRQAPTSPAARFVGHTDNIRDICLSSDGQWLLSASSDSTIKLWSITASRLFHTFSMHDDSVWSLTPISDNLQSFYSSDRSGNVLKTDLSKASYSDIENNIGICASICKEDSGVYKVAHGGDYLWTATCSSNIRRWQDVSTEPYVEALADAGNSSKSDIEHFEVCHFVNLGGGPSLMFSDRKDEQVVPFRKEPLEVLSGSIGFIKHRVLTDRRRVLTLDTAGEVKEWDLMKCQVLRSFGTGIDIDDLADDMNNLEAVANWCTVQTRTGELYIALDQRSAFDAEVYADELDLEGTFAQDHRINLGKWVIRNLLNGILEQVATTTPQAGSDGAEAAGLATHPGRRKGTTSAPTSAPGSPVIQAARPDPEKTDAVHSESVEQHSTSTSQTATTHTTASTKDTEPTTKKSRKFGNLFKKKEKPKAKVVIQPPPEEAPKPPPVEKPVIYFKDVLRDLEYVRSPPQEEAPFIEIPPYVRLMISEQLPNSGNSMDLYKGTVGEVRSDYEVLQDVIPEWIANLLLKDEIPDKDLPKIAFQINPLDGNEESAANQLRLTAYTMLRARRIAGYVAEKLNIQVPEGQEPWQLVELSCQGSPVDVTMTLAQIRTRLWRSGGDVVIHYKLKNNDRVNGAAV